MSQILEADEELDLIRRWQDDGDRKALDRLLRKFDLLVHKHAWRESKSAPEIREDLVQEGRRGLLKAADKFDCAQGNRFYTYAVWWVRVYMQDFAVSHMIGGKSGCVGRAGRNARIMLGKMGGCTTEQEREDLRAEYAANAKLSVDTMRHVELAFARTTELNVTGSHDEDTISTIIADDAPSPEEVAISNIDTDRQRQAVRMAASELTGREREVYRLRYETDPQVTLLEISKGLGISAERARQIEQAAIKRVSARAHEILPTLAAKPRPDVYAPKPTDEKPVRSRRPSQRKLEAIRQDRLNGMTWTAISAKHGYRARVGARLALEGAGMLTDDLIAVNDQTAISAKPQRGRRLAPQVLEQLGREWRTSRRKKEIAKRYGYSNTTGAWRALKNAGLLDPHPE